MADPALTIAAVAAGAALTKQEIDRRRQLAERQRLTQAANANRNGVGFRLVDQPRTANGQPNQQGGN